MDKGFVSENVDGWECIRVLYLKMYMDGNGNKVRNMNMDLDINED